MAQNMKTRTRKGGDLYEVDQLVKKLNTRIETMARKTSNIYNVGGMNMATATMQIEVEQLASKYGLTLTKKLVSSASRGDDGSPVSTGIEITIISRSKDNLEQLKQSAKPFEKELESKKLASYEARAVRSYLKKYPNKRPKTGQKLDAKTTSQALAYYRDVTIYNSFIELAYEIYQDELELEAANDSELDVSTLDVLEFWRGHNFTSGGDSVVHDITETDENFLRNLVDTYADGSHLWKTQTLGDYTFQGFTDLLAKLKGLNGPDPNAGKILGDSMGF